MNKVYMIVYLSTIVCLDQWIAAVLDCNFEAGFCDWKNDSTHDFDWERRTGGTPTKNTGPASDHTTGSGHYIYIEASQKDKGEKSRIMSPWQVSGQHCLTFWYNMYGGEIGALNVYLLENDIETLIFNKDGGIGNRRWWKSVLNIQTNYIYQIVFEGVIGDGSTGDIAIDDVEIKLGLCSIDCDFEYDFCNWMQSYDDVLHWNRAKRTTGEFYSYVETRNQYGIGILLSPMQNAGKFCLGRLNGILQIELWKTNGSKIIINSLTAQSVFWQFKRILISSEDPFQIVFKGESTEYFISIAIDEVTMSVCNDCPDPTPNRGFVNNTNFQYGSVLKIYCEHGYMLEGNSVITCKSMGRWDGYAECIPHDCENHIIPNGSFLTPNGTTFGQVGRHECDTGFVLVGKQSINCTVNGWSDTSAFCNFVDCGNHKIQNGIFITPNGTTFGQVGIQECDNGFVLMGEQSSTCTVTGWSNTSAYCQIEDAQSLEFHTSPLVVAYVLIPVIVLIVGAVVTVVYMRKKHPSCLRIFQNDNESRNVSTGISLSQEKHLYDTHNKEFVQLDDGYSTIAQETNKSEGLDTVYYNVAKGKSSEYYNENHSEGRDKTDYEM